MTQEISEKTRLITSRAKETVNEGTEQAKTCSETLADVVQRSSELSRMIQAISDAAKEQTKGVSEISQALEQMNASTQENTKISGEATSLAVDLNNRSQQLLSSASDLLSLIGSDSNRGDDPRTPAPGQELKSITETGHQSEDRAS